MTELDKLFPEAAERQRKAKAEFNGRKGQRTYFAHAPECQEVCDAFLDVMGWSADPYTIGVTTSGGRDFAKVHGNDPALIIKTVKHLELEAPHIYDNIASPRSLITPARSVKKMLDPDSVESRRRYTRGIDDE